MKLSLGTVCQDRLVCPYHGWSYDNEGRGESPSAPRLHACVPSYDCAAASGVVWVKARGTPQDLPVLAKDGWDFAGAVFNRLRAPLQLVIDNFSEVEHTVATHPHFGFEPAAAEQAVVDLEAAEDSVTVRGCGPAKTPPLDTRLSVGFRRGDRFHAEYTFRFDPPRSSVTHWWSDPRTGRERMLKYYVVHYFVPEDDTATLVVTFAFLKIRWPILWRVGPRVGWLLRRRIWDTVQEDAFLVEHLADQSTSLAGMRLSRFDAILGLTRARLLRIYDGNCGAD
jgi:vanillate O-demethylase monooxygenase subunit